jgi:peptidoglycan biosynthesis protein MviN/MurJ (putative lipid II flippase)
VRATTQALTVHLTRIVLPAQVFFIVGGIVQAVLLAQQRFLAADQIMTLTEGMGTKGAWAAPK